ncbi:Synaptojanin-1 [Schistosoma japonicum]|nr:Synaptojanin-1 [Schistosoma japonicum]
MSFLKNCRVLLKSGSIDFGESLQQYNVILENRFVKGALLFDSGAIAQISPMEFDFRKYQYTKAVDAYACLGVLVPLISPVSDSSILASQSYLVLATGCTSVGKLPAFEVFRITNVQFINLKCQAFEEDVFSDLRKLLSSGMFYFARSSFDGKPYDLTVNIQNRSRLGDEILNTGDIYSRGDSGLNFLWNKGLMGPLIRSGINPSDWLVSIICGGFEVCTVYCGIGQARVGVISRVSAQRPGTRFHVRGINDCGDVANFVETEQFVYLGDSVTSYIQVRGTVPLFWEQPGLQVGSHKISLSRPLEISVSAFERHFLNLISQYGSVGIVNLLGCKQGEAMLSKAYQDLHRKSSFRNSIQHIVFDYHSELQSKGAKCLDWINQQISQLINDWGYFYANGQQVESCQTGVLRINCVDCLDRTNAIQTLVGVQLILPKMLMSLGVNVKDQHIVVNRFVDGLRQLWQQNGDHVSRIYAGTGALGSGRSKLRDAQRTAVRTIQHSFFDSAKQEAMHALLSNSSLQGWMKLVGEQYLPRRLLHLSPTLLTNILHRYSEFIQIQNLRLFVGTWNVNGGKHFRSVAHKHECVTDWLLDLAQTINPKTNWGYKSPDSDDSDELNKPIDIFAVGFEEIVDLTTSNIVAGSKPSANQRDWGQFLQRHLNRDADEQDSYLLITSVQLVGVCLFLFVRKRLADSLRNIATSSVKTGLGGTAGNKGAVAIHFQLGATSICFVCSHFTAGQSAVRERNDDFQEICRRLSLPDGRTILSHDYVFWCGDFNYRINLTGNEVKRLVAQSCWLDLLRSDQLTIERLAGNVFRGFEEGPIRFAPTYKYDLFCDDYDTSEKARSPAWTDRILWRRVKLSFPKTDDDGIICMQNNSPDIKWNPGRLLLYNRAELKTSDHRPVGAIFNIEVHVISRQSRRKVISNVFEDYGPINATVQLNLKILERNSKQPLSTDAKPYLLNDTDFLENLKLTGSSRHGTILLLHFLDPFTILLLYANSKQATIAASFLNNYIIPWDGLSNGLPKVTGGYEIHLSSSLYNSANWLTEMRRLVEISEREEANIHGCQITPEIFEALSSTKRSDKPLNKYDDNNEQTLNSDDEDFESNTTSNSNVISTIEPPQSRSRPPPPRPAPPLPRQLISNKDEFDPTIDNSIDTQKLNSDFLSQTESKSDVILKSFSRTQSETTSPVHKFSSKLNTTIPNDLFVPHNNSEIHMVSSCLNLHFKDNSSLQYNSKEENHISSTSDLIGLEFEINNSNAICPSVHLSDSVNVPPPLPLRPDDGNISSSKLEHNLLTDDPFSFVHLSQKDSFPTMDHDEDSALISFDPVSPTRVAPQIPSRHIPPPLPPRPKTEAE